ncbi:TetR/AcrR family transcriptional regulator [Mycolicibacterium sp. Dal123E01]|uniref:TetR/AcrR family transcriptional regulator n=1 Tax=Mycolicibacterium sp. Dal123E01 TaxID=3457578 RepID=UPI00403EE29C
MTVGNGGPASPQVRPATRRQAQADRTRQKLLDAAVQHFSQRHYEAVAASDITESASVAQGLLFHYFANKRGIYLAALQEAALLVGAATTPLPAADASPGDQFRQMIRAHLTYLGDHRDFALRLILGGGGGDPEARAIFDRARWRTVEWTCELLELDITRPSMRLMLRSCAGSLDEATIFWLENDLPFDREAMVEVVVSLLITSLRCAAELDPAVDDAHAIAALAARTA